MSYTDKKDILKILSNTILFKNTPPSILEYASSNCTVNTSKKGETISHKDKGLFIILEGKASVFEKNKNKPVLLNTLEKHMVFGMASIFGKECSTTMIKAKDNCTYALLSQECIEEMLKSDITFTKNYICFLSDKIRFLNKKIAFFTSGSAEKKVAGYILSLPHENGKVKIDMSLSKLASVLDIGRASLYRALDSLEENCFIKKQNTVITINSYDEFKKIYGESL